MGTGGSFLRNPDDDDILGSDLNGSSHGVIKRIPIEMKPRGNLGLRSGVGSLGKKPKGGSLRSALSIDLENQEVERIRKDFEMYRLNKDNEIANMQKKEQKLETENKRLRAELLVLQKTCNNMQQERDAAVEEKCQALMRAAQLSMTDKVQRMFKIFRETKNAELQALLTARRELENKLTKIAHGYFSDENDTPSRTGLEGPLGNSNPGGDWWTAIESEPSLGSSAHLHNSTLRGPEFAHSMMEMEGPFTNVHKEDWSTALANLTQIVPSIPEHALSNTLRLYISAPRDCQAEVDIFTKEYRSKLNGLCENEGRSLLLVYLHLEDDENLSSLVF